MIKDKRQADPLTDRGVYLPSDLMTAEEVLIAADAIMKAHGEFLQIGHYSARSLARTVLNAVRSEK